MKERQNEKIIVLVAVLILAAVFVGLFVRNNLSLSPTIDEACPAITMTQAPSSCFDSDGNNIFNRGYIELKFGLQEAPTVTAAAMRNVNAASSKYWDECSSKVRVCELGCNGKMPKTQVVSCPNGYYCNAGKCIAKICGNNITEDGEECDGISLNGQTCEDFGYLGGNLNCKGDCTFNTNNCYGSLGNCTSDDNCTKCYQCNLGIGECESKNELCADFKAEELVYVDSNGIETWEPVGMTPDNKIENGLKGRYNGLDYSSGIGSDYFSGGDTYFRWKIVYTFCQAAICNFTLTGPTEFNITLTIRNVTSGQSDNVTKTIYVAPGMQLLSSTPSPGVNFNPLRVVFAGSDVWVMSWDGLIGVVNVANPMNLSPVQTMPGISLPEKTGMAYANGRLYIAEVSYGVDVYNADRNNFYLLHHFSSADLGVQKVQGVGAVGDFFFVITTPDKLLTYNLLNPSTPVASLTLPIRPDAMVQLGNEALVLSQSSGTSLIVVDVRNPASPTISQVIQPGTKFGTSFISYRHHFAIDTLTGSLKGEIIVPTNPSEPLIVSPNPLQTLQTAVNFGAMTSSRLYVRTGYDIAKYNIVDPREPIQLMQPLYPIAPGACANFIYDPDGPEGPQPGYVFIGYGFGFRAFTP